MKLYLSRQRDGNYMLTRLAPILSRVGVTDFKDFYFQTGEPVGVRHLCPLGVKMMFGVDIAIGESVRVELTGKQLSV